MFKERKKFALLSLLSALVVVSTAFVGVSIYAETDDSELTTFEEEAIKAGEKFEDMDKARSGGTDDDAKDDSTTTIADVSSLFDGLILCDVGTAEVSGETQTAEFDKESLTTPTVSVTVMTRAEIANETLTASSADNETSTSSIDCVSMGKGGSTSTAKAKDGADAAASNETSTASASESDDQILVIEGQDFVLGQAVLIFSEGALVGIDDVAKDGSIGVKVPVPNSGGTATAADDDAASSTELRFVETGTQRTGTFEFDGETLTAAAEGGEIEAEDDDGAAMPAPSSDNATSSDSTSNYTAQ